LKYKNTVSIEAQYNLRHKNTELNSQSRERAITIRRDRVGIALWVLAQIFLRFRLSSALGEVFVEVSGIEALDVAVTAV